MIQVMSGNNDMNNKIDTDSSDMEVGSPEKTEQQKTSDLTYGVSDSPPWNVNILCGLQLMLTCLSGPLVVVYFIYSNTCTGDNPIIFAQLMSTSIFLMGLCTLLQVLIGVRLPTVQGSCTSFLVPILAMMQMEQFKCPPLCSDTLNGISNATTLSSSAGPVNYTSVECEDEPWRDRFLQINGALIYASLIHTFLGMAGVIGVLQNFIGPLTICPAISLIGLSLYPVAANAAKHHWGVAMSTIGAFVVFSLFLSRFSMPLPVCDRKRHLRWSWFPVFKVFPILLALLAGWFICYILTVTNTIPDDKLGIHYLARTDARAEVFGQSKWFNWPRPAQWGTPTFNLGVFVGMISVVISSVIESTGDYYAMASMCCLPTPPQHAVNRGIAIEGFGSIISGILGACHATTSYSQVVGIIAVSGVASRSTCVFAGLCLLLCGVIGKFGAILAMCPEPVLGGLAIANFGMVVSIGMSSLQHCDTNSVRNLMILGMSFMMGMVVPYHLKTNPGAINTGIVEMDQVLSIFLMTSMFVGGSTGFILDNLVPGDPHQRGIGIYLNDLKGNTHSSGVTRHHSAYDIPLISDWFRSHSIFSYVPVLPSFMGLNIGRGCCKRKELNTAEVENIKIDYLLQK